MIRIYNAIQNLLIRNGPQIATPGEAWHCTELTAYAGAALADLTEVLRPSSVWWRQMNIWNARDPWSPLAAAEEIALALGTRNFEVIGPHRPQELEELDPGLYLAQGWRVLPDPDAGEPGDGHAFFVEALNLFDDQGFQLGRVIESSKKHGLRVAGVRWTSPGQWKAQPLPAPERIEDRVSRYIAGVGFSPLWTEPLRATLPTLVPEEPKPQEVPVGITIDDNQRDDILDTAIDEFKALVAQVKAKTITPGAVVESGLDLVAVIVAAMIPGSVDDTLIAFALPYAKSFLVGAVDRAVGTNRDAVALRERAAQRRLDAQEHLDKADAKEAAGKTGGFLSLSPEKHRIRAAELIKLAEADEAKAAELEAVDL